MLLEIRYLCAPGASKAMNQIIVFPLEVGMFGVFDGQKDTIDSHFSYQIND